MLFYQFLIISYTEGKVTWHHAFVKDIALECFVTINTDNGISSENGLLPTVRWESTAGLQEGICRVSCVAMIF